MIVIPYADGDFEAVQALWRETGIRKNYNDPGTEIARVQKNGNCLLYVGREDGRVVIGKTKPGGGLNLPLLLDLLSGVMCCELPARSLGDGVDPQRLDPSRDFVRLTRRVLGKNRLGRP